MATTGTFLVTAADGETAVLRDVERGRVHTLADAPDLAEGTALRATLEPDPPLEVTWSLSAVDERWTVTVAESADPPTDAEREAAAGLDAGASATLETPAGETDVLAVPREGTADAAREVATDQATLARAARLGVERVTVASGEGVVAVRYGAGTR